MDNENNLPKKLGFFRRLIHPRAVEEYIAEMQRIHEQENAANSAALAALSSKLNEKDEQLKAVQEQLKEFIDARDLGLTAENLRSWQDTLSTRQSQLDAETEKNAEIRNELLARQREQEELAVALKNWQETLSEIQNMNDPEKVQAIASLRQQIEDIKKSAQERADLLQDALKQVVEEIIPGRDEKIAELESTNYGLTDQIKGLQSEGDTAKKLANTEQQRAEAAEKRAKEVTTRLNAVLGAYKEAGIINDDKDEQALALENEFRGNLIKYAQEYKKEKSSIEGYISNPADYRHGENRAMYIASCLGALTAYSEMDSRKDLNTEIRVAIMNAARVECTDYVLSDWRKLNNAETNAQRFMGWFADAFIENRFKPEYLHHYNSERFKDRIIEDNYGFDGLGRIRIGFNRTTFQVPYTCNWDMLKDGHTYSPDLLDVLNNNETYHELGGTQVSKGDER